MRQKWVGRAPLLEKFNGSVVRADEVGVEAKERGQASGKQADHQVRE